MAKQRGALHGQRKVGDCRSRTCGGGVRDLRPHRRYGNDPACRGENIQRTYYYVQKRSGGVLPCKEKADVAWPRTRLQPNIVAVELPRTEGGREKGGCERYAAHRPPPAAEFWPSTTTNS